jgi:hypothetical protein
MLEEQGEASALGVNLSSLGRIKQNPRQLRRAISNGLRMLTELRSVLETFFVRASYLIGHIDGMEGTLEKEAPALAEAISKTTWLQTLWTRYWEQLRTLFEKIEEWEGVSEYQPLKNLGEELLMRGGMGFVKLPTGGYFVGFNPTKNL